MLHHSTCPVKPSRSHEFFFALNVQTRSLQSVQESALSDRLTTDINHDVVLAGIVHHGGEISTNSLSFVLEVTCVNKVRAHILGADDMSILSAMYERQKQIMFPNTSCAPLKVSTQPDYVSAEENRIDRIQAARDYQRIVIAQHFDFADLDHATIILADLDVNELPPRDQVVNNADKMNRREGSDVDILCAAGLMHDPYGYYDTFATVLLPDTFVYPVNGRPIQTARPVEDASMIIGNDFNAQALMEWFRKEGGVEAKPVPVKSCFGGLAIYRASKWLDQRCSYKNVDPEMNAKYANRYDNAPCEHVVLHNCLQAVDPTIVVAVQPDMHTIWHTSTGSQYALSNHPDIALNFVLEHLSTVRNSRRLQVIVTDSINSTITNTTMNTTVTSWNNTNSSGTIPQWIIDEVFDSEFFDVNCVMFANATNATDSANITTISTNSTNSTNSTGSNCTLVSPERRMETFNKLFQFLYEGPVNCTNATTNCTNSTPVFNDFIRWVYGDADTTINFGNFTNSTNTTVTPPPRELDIVLKQKTKPKLDFVIAGFPKCGTTSLLYAFNSNLETSVGMDEECSIENTGLSDQVVFERLDHDLSQLSQDPSVKRGIKCPIGLSNGRSLDRLDQYSPETKLLIGVRHPVKYFQSYYNYRITEIYDNNLAVDTIPPIESLVGKNEWNGVSTDSARFELYLMQLAKTEMSVADFADMTGRPHLAVKPNKFKIFLYTLAQMEDETEDRKMSFRQQMRTFLGLDKPMDALVQKNKNQYVGTKSHKETIDICDAKYDSLRTLLIEQGKKSQQWIRDEFILSPDVTVGNKDHFLAMLDTWSHDPCREYLSEGIPGADGSQSSGGVWLYIKSFIAPFFDMIGSLFGY